jgi:hypothetical protein
VCVHDDDHDNRGRRSGVHDQVQLSYALRLPTLDDPFDNEVLDATWTEPAARELATAPPLHLPPPRQHR